MNTVSKRYANALINFGDFDTIKEELSTIKQALLGNQNLIKILQNPTMSTHSAENLIEEIFKDKIDGRILNFLKLLAQNDRFDCIFDIIEEYFEKLNKIQNIQKVHVTSAIPLDDGQVAELKQKLENKLQKQIIFEFNVDEAIMAGLVVKIGSKTIDTSLKTQIEMMKKQLT